MLNSYLEKAFGSPLCADASDSRGKLFYRKLNFQSSNGKVSMEIIVI